MAVAPDSPARGDGITGLDQGTQLLGRQRYALGLPLPLPDNQQCRLTAILVDAYDASLAPTPGIA